MVRQPEQDFSRDLPLKTEVFEILMRLAEGNAHGYAIMRDVADRSQGAIDMLPGTLYRHLRWMLERGLIEEIGRRSATDTGNRRRVYRTTAVGRKAAKAEASRLQRQIAAALERKLIPESRSR